jgi:nicotinamide-nucleotide amidase
LLDTGARPQVATYARADAVDIRIWSHAGADDATAVGAGSGAGAGDAAALVAATEARVLELVGEYLWARGETTWPEAVADALDSKGWSVSIVEVATRGAVVGLLGEGLGDRLAFAESLIERPAPHAGHRATLEDLAERVRELGSSEVGVAAEARERGGDTAVTVAVVTPDGSHRETRVVFLAGPLGRARAAIATAAILLKRLQDPAPR